MAIRPFTNLTQPESNLDPNRSSSFWMKPIESRIPEWKKSLSAFGKETKAFGAGLAALGAHAVGAEGVRDAALESYQRNLQEAQTGWRAPKVGRIEDIRLGEEGGFGRLGEYAAYQIPKGLLTLGTMVGTGGVGAAVGKIATKKATKALAKEFAQDLAEKKVSSTIKESAAEQVRKNITRGAVGGAGAGSFGLEGGSLFGELATTPEVGPEKAFGPAIVGGVGSAALDVVPALAAGRALGVQNWVKTGLRKVIKETPELAKEAKRLARTRRVGKGVVGGAVVEGPTEGLQELIQTAATRFAKDDPVFGELSEEEKSAFWNSVAAGTLIGGVAGGAIGPFTQPSTTEVLSEETAAPAAETTSEEGKVGTLGEQAERVPVTQRVEGETDQEYMQRLAEVQDELRVQRTEREVEKRIPAAEGDVIAEVAPRREEPSIPIPTTVKPQVEEAVEYSNPLQENDLPFKSSVAAQAAIDQTGRGETHQVVETDIGYGIQSRVGEPTATVPIPIPQEISNAIEEQKARTVYADVPELARPEGGQEAVPATEGGRGILPGRQEEEVLTEVDVVNTLTAKGGEGYKTQIAARARINKEWKEGGELVTQRGRRKDAKTRQQEDGTWVVDVLESRAPVWRSALYEAVGSIKQDRAQGAQWLGTLRKQPGVKQEEIEATGLGDWLETQKGAVTKESVEEFLRRGGVRVEEVVKEGPGFEGRSARLDVLITRENAGTITEDEINELAELERSVNRGEQDGAVDTKFADYQVPGGENYRELLVTIPARSQQEEFRASHFDEPNILVHLRFNERMDAEGKRVLFVEEVQSDWHQKGRKQGYRGQQDRTKLPSGYELKQEGFTVRVIDSNGYNVATEDNIEDAIARTWERVDQEGGMRFEGAQDVPNAPFKSSWPLLGMKRAIRWAAENGFDRVAWTPGEVQADRYDLSKQAGIVFYSPSGLLMIYGRGENRNTLLLREQVAEEKLSDYIGKDLADKLLKVEPTEQSGIYGRRLIGDDLKVGGAGMYAFYDKMLPAAVNKFVKKYGAKVGKTKIPTDAPAKAQEVWSIDVTPALREEALRGLPLFSRGPEFASSISLINFVARGDRILGQGITQRAIDTGILHINETSPIGASSGSFDRSTGIMTVNLDKIPEEQTPESVLLHEGRHAGLAQVLGKTIDSFHTDLIKLGNSGSVIAKQALEVSTKALAKSLGIENVLDETLPRHEWQAEYDRVREEINRHDPTLLLEEDLAYYIQYAANNPDVIERGFLRRLLDAIRVWWSGTGFGQALAQIGIRPELGEGFAVGLAKQATRRVVRNAEQARQEIDVTRREIGDVPSAARFGTLMSRFTIPTRTGQDTTLLVDSSPREIAGLLSNEEARAQREGNRFFEGVRLLKDPRDGSLYAWPAAANLLHRDVALKMGIDTSLYNIVPVSGQVIEEGQIADVLGEMPEELGILKKSPTVQLETAPAREEVGSILYSRPMEILHPHLRQFHTSPVASRVEDYSQPGLFDRWFAAIVDKFRAVKPKSETLYTSFDEMAARASAYQDVVKREYLEPLRHMVSRIDIDAGALAAVQENYKKNRFGDEPSSTEVIGHQLAARHVTEDRVNEQLAQRAAPEFLRELRKNLPKQVVHQLNREIGSLTEGSIAVAKLTNEQAQQLVEKYRSSEVLTEGKSGKEEQVINARWTLWKRRASGYSSATPGSVEAQEDKNAGFLNVHELYNQRVRNKRAFEEIGELVDALGQHNLGILQEGGLLTSEEIAHLTKTYAHYVPLRREAFDYDKEVRRIFEKPGEGVGKLITRDGDIELPNAVHVIQNILAQGFTASNAAARNQMMNEFADELDADKGGKVWGDWFHFNDTYQHRGSMGFVRNGKQLYIEPDKNNIRAAGIARAINQLDAQEMIGPMKLMRAVNSWIRWVNVSASPAFMLANVPRDAGTALYNLQATEAKEHWREIFGNYGKSFKALKTVIIQGMRDKATATPEQLARIKMVERFEQAGGRTSFAESLREMDSSWRSFDAQVQRRRGKLGAVVEWGRNRLEDIENVNIAMENVMRLATFDTLVEKGVSDVRAAQISRDLTTNFTRKGYHTSAINTWWLFFNATVQGNWQVVDNMLHGKGRKKLQAAVAGTIAFSFLIDQLGRALSDDEDNDGVPDWDAISSREKERNIVLPFRVGGTYPSIPAPWVFNVFWRLGGMLSEATNGITKPQDIALDSIGLMINTFNPIQSGSVAQAVSPTAFDPFMQIIEGKDFIGNPLGPTGYPGASKRPDAYLAWDSTPEGLDRKSVV